MIRVFAFALICGLLIAMSACGNQTYSEVPSPVASSPQESAWIDGVDDSDPSRALVAYFAYSENIGDTSDMTVDAIASASVGSTDNTEGNLQIMAQVIEATENADVFHIVASKPYAAEYNVMHDRAVDEINNGELPDLTDRVENLEQYDVVYLGMPVCSGSLPRPVATFLTENDLSGKTIVPFGINLGSGFGNMISEIEELCPGATLVDGFTVSARMSNDEVRAEFSQWLDVLELN